MGNPANVRVGYRGQLVVGAPGALFPSDPKTAWDGDDFLDMGLVSDGGVVIGGSQTVQEFFAWGAPTSPVRTQVTNEEFTVQCTLIETTAPVLSVYYGVPLSQFTNHPVDEDNDIPQFISFTKGLADAPDIRALGLDIIDGTRLKRYEFPRAQVTDRGDITAKSDELMGYQVTFKALLSSDNISMKLMVSDIDPTGTGDGDLDEIDGGTP